MIAQRFRFFEGHVDVSDGTLMTVDELIGALQSLPAEWRALPAFIHDHENGAQPIMRIEFTASDTDEGRQRGVPEDGMLLMP